MNFESLQTQLSYLKFDKMTSPPVGEDRSAAILTADESHVQRLKSSNSTGFLCHRLCEKLCEKLCLIMLKGKCFQTLEIWNILLGSLNIIRW